jgi:DNA-binding NarL/FixJ family response regulator
MPLRILLVDDHKIMRAGIRAILKTCKEFIVIGEAESGSEAIAECTQKHPDMIVMDIGLAGMNGIETTQLIVRSAPETMVVMLSIYDDENSVVSAIRSGAQAYVLKKASGSDLLAAMRMVAKGGSYLSPQVSDRLLQRIRRADPESAPANSQLELLTPRELQVFRLVAAGNASKEIAEILDLELNTVHTYRKTMMRKLHLSKIAGITQLAFATGLTLPSVLPGERRAPVLAAERVSAKSEIGMLESQIYLRAVTT